MTQKMSSQLLQILQSGDYEQATGQKSTVGGGGFLSSKDDGMSSFINPTYLDKETNQYYMPMYSDSGLDAAGNLIRNLTGYYGFDASTPDSIGKLNNLYDTEGNYTGQYETADPKEGEWLDKLIVGTIGAIAGGAAWSGLGGAGSAGSMAGDAYLPGQLGVDGAAMGGNGVLPGLEQYLVNGTGIEPFTFNAAKDSQFANEALGLDAVTSATPPAIPVNGVTGVPPGSGLTTPGTTTPPAGTGSTGGTSVKDLIKAGGSAAVKAVTGGGTGGGTGGANFGINDLLKLIAGGVDLNNQNTASKDMLEYLKGRQAINDNMYAPGSPEFNSLWSEMSRKDAAGGRNSQYGPRSVDLAARVAQLKMDANTRMTTGIGNLYKGALDQKASAPSGLLAALGGATGGTGGLDIGSLIQKMISGGWTPNLENTVDEDTFQPEGGDLGQYL